MPYEWNGQTLNAAGQLVNTVTDANGCEYEEVLNLTVNASQADAIEAVIICAGELPYEWRGQTLTAAGQYSNEIADDNGCAYNEVLNLTVNASQADAIEAVTICAGELPYEWRRQTLTAAGQYSNEIVDDNGCAYNEVLNLTVNASQADAIEAVTICAGELPYDWRGQTLTAAGQYSNEIADDNGCAYNEVLNLTVNASQADAIEAVTICAGELPYEWRGQALTAAGQYINGIIDDNDCAYNEVLNLTVNASQADEVTDLNICSKELPYDWNGQTLSSEGQYIHTVSDLSLIHI